ncbi:uncharacterized protein Dana_GF27850 [Drosophila ananassae]|uniref:MD-2-related lipid-recognition domain-containing protein n=1 Tax=Drosophila ananassae TaxID=7217 RepID=A0A0P9BQD4_DROAN|nr:uncharacterized protein Dana_GF27850 [Drosophila ananassae]
MFNKFHSLFWDEQLILGRFAMRTILLFINFNTKLQVKPAVEFRNIICTSLDKTFSDFEYCYLKSINRTYKYFSLKVNLFKVPITSVTVNLALYKRFNGYKPFLYNITVDACKFYKNKKSFPVALYFYELWREVSNINHSCPYNHDLILEKLTTDKMNHHLTTVLPFPEGDYMVQMHWYAYGINRATFQIFLSKDK